MSDIDQIPNSQDEHAFCEFRYLKLEGALSEARGGENVNLVVEPGSDDQNYTLARGHSRSLDLIRAKSIENGTPTLAMEPHEVHYKMGDTSAENTQTVYLDFKDSEMFLRDEDRSEPYLTRLDYGWFMYQDDQQPPEPQNEIRGKMICLLEGDRTYEKGNQRIVPARLFELTGNAIFNEEQTRFIRSDFGDKASLAEVQEWYEPAEPLSFQFRCSTTGTVQTLKAVVSRHSKHWRQPDGSLFLLEMDNTMQSIPEIVSVPHALWKASRQQSTGQPSTHKLVIRGLERWIPISEDEHTQIEGLIDRQFDSSDTDGEVAEDEEIDESGQYACMNADQPDAELNSDEMDVDESG